MRCFGGFDVVYGEQRLSATGQTGPRHRSWEVLAYLAAQPSEVVSTEKLLAAVWPDSDADRAGSAFGAALSRLRGVLLHQVPGLTGPLVLRDRVGRTCRLDGAALVSDVHAFAALCREGRRLPPAAAAAAYERARALYSGDLLRDQPYPWLHERDDDGLTLPERYRETYRQITNDLAGLSVQGGAPERAVALVPRAAEGRADSRRRRQTVVPLLRAARRPGLAGARAPPLAAGPARSVRAPRRGGDPALTDPEPETVAAFEEVLALLDAGDGPAPSQHLRERPRSPWAGRQAEA